MRDEARGSLLLAVIAAGAFWGTAEADLPAAAPETAHASGARPEPVRTLTVCADPNNLPFSNQAGEGFENRIARLVAHDLGMQLSYLWWAQRRGYVRNTLTAAKCDLWPGIAAGVDNVATTHPYYRSTYVFVTRRSERLQGLTLDDPRLRSLSIGVQMVGNDAMNTPPAHAIARRGVVRNVRGFMLYGNYENPNPPARIVEAVADRNIDVAMVWGPLAGYFASRSPVALRLEPVTPSLDAGVWPMTYDIAMGVRRNEPELRERVERVLQTRKDDIDAVLRAYHVPVLPIMSSSSCEPTAGAAPSRRSCALPTDR
jgi:mxaJ protein